MAFMRRILLLGIVIMYEMVNLRHIHSERSICIVAKKWLTLISSVLFTLSDAKHQREKLLMLNATLTMNRPYIYPLRHNYNAQ